ncbi:ROK family protein [Egicoccus sp. AB-alg6-2]|uniref:ROK family protein n=1 Tax=Egicoccus sp. AB-alg6-2 TaxID=3242692 RepID=UPI00359CCC12
MTAIGVDIGGSTTEVVRIGPDGGIEGHALVPTRPGAALVDGTIEAIRRVAPTGGVDRIGVGIPGQVDRVDGSVGLAVNLGIDGVRLPLGSRLAAAFDAHVEVENDARAAALGAHVHLAPDADVLVFLGIGTGVAAGVVIDGRIHRGRNGMAGEIGHVVVDPTGPACRCGQRGCLEALVSGGALRDRWPAGGAEAAAHLFRRATVGDPDARVLADEVTAHLATAITWLVVAYGADVAVLGGGVGRIGEPLLQAVRGRLAEQASRSEVAGFLLGPERIRCAPAEGPLGAVGAAALVGATARPLEDAATPVVAMNPATPG